MKYVEVQTIGSVIGARWFCPSCDEQECDLASRLTNAVENMRSSLGKQMESLINKLKLDLVSEFIISEKSQPEAKPSFADTLKSTKTEPVLIVRPVSKQDCSVSKTEIKSRVDIAKLSVGVSNVREGKEGTLIIGCEDNVGREKLKNEIEEKLENKYEVRVPESMLPRIRLNGCKDMNGVADDEVVKTIIQQNNLKIGKGVMKVITRLHNKFFKDENIILEVDPATKDKIFSMGKLKCGWCIVDVKDHIHIRRCYKCNEFLHLAKDCKNKSRCARCGEVGGHSDKDCSAEEVKCCNCNDANVKFNLRLDTNHKAYDLNCPTYLTKVRRKLRQVKVSN
ncbi:hypothetical protein RI129_009197 [Pyrocoelia pectoralis]